MFRKLLYKDCLDWMKTVTNIILDENAIDMSCAKYTNTGKNCNNMRVLGIKILCHTAVYIISTSSIHHNWPLVTPLARCDVLMMYTGWCFN
jgi:hypothetical protein